jgi:hypothetical protein
LAKMLETAFAEASKLSERDQDALASRILEELADEQKWDESFRASADALSRLADEALAEHRSGRTELLDPDRL